MKKALSLLIVAVLLCAVCTGCGGEKSGGAKDGRTVAVNGVEVTLDKTDTYENKVSYLTSSDFKTKYSTLTGMIYYIPQEGVDTPYTFDNVLYLAVFSASYNSLEKALNTLNTEPDTFSDVVIEEKEINDRTWTYASYTKHVEDPDTLEPMDLLFHKYMTEIEFNGMTELLEISIQPATDTAAFEAEFMNSVTLIEA